MCGIAGVVEFDGAPPGAARTAAERMVAALGHRGPDGAGLVEWRGDDTRGSHAVLGHTRLAVLDLSERGAQPMRNDDGRIGVTYNGEVYNFAAVRRELEGLGRRFVSRSDTEVIVHGYEVWGREVVSRLRGMFAFGVWDAGRRTLLLARDRFGIKPLYVHRANGRLVFASEVRALLASGLVPARLDTEALDWYLRYQTVPAPRTLVRDVRLLPPGTVLEAVAERDAGPETYWDLLDAAGRLARTPADDVLPATRRLLREAAELHLVSDVPVGIFLSGGIDSSALVSLVRSVGQRPRTFAVTMAGTPQDEAPYARAVAATFDADHHEIPLDDAALVGQLPDALDAIDHPSGDGINTFVVSRAVRRAGMKVALSGLGGDELFGGYPSFARLARLPAFAGFWQWTPPAMRRAAAAAVRSLGRESVAAVKTAAVLEGDASLPSAFPVLRELFSREQRARLRGGGADASAVPDPYMALLERAAARHDAADVMALVSYAEARTYMHDVLLRDTDQMAMRHGLEVRVPLLDHVLAEHVVSLPAAAKSRPGQAKPLLVDALERPLPETGVARPKQGFVLPFDRWMRGALRPLCEHHLGPGGLAGHGALDAGEIASVWQRFLAGSPRTTWARPWTLVALSAWLERTGVSVR